MPASPARTPMGTGGRPARWRRTCGSMPPPRPSATGTATATRQTPRTSSASSRRPPAPQTTPAAPPSSAARPPPPPGVPARRLPTWPPATAPLASRSSSATTERAGSSTPAEIALARVLPSDAMPAVLPHKLPVATSPSALRRLPSTPARLPLNAGIIGRRTELVLFPLGQGYMHLVSPHEPALIAIWVHVPATIHWDRLLGIG